MSQAIRHIEPLLPAEAPVVPTAVTVKVRIGGVAVTKPVKVRVGGVATAVTVKRRG